MARIRKKHDVLAIPAVQWKVALYIRLSREDGYDESCSVVNQRNRLTAYLENLMLEENAELADYYVDDGYTGTDSDRDDFQRMLNDIDVSVVNCVIVKDLSRLSRNDWECKRYLQQLFVVKNVRFISLDLPKLDSYKNPDAVYDLAFVMQSMYNENHCRETSVKVRGTFDMKRKNETKPTAASSRFFCLCGLSASVVGRGTARPTRIRCACSRRSAPSRR